MCLRAFSASRIENDHPVVLANCGQSFEAETWHLIENCSIVYEKIGKEDPLAIRHYGTGLCLFVEASTLKLRMCGRQPPEVFCNHRGMLHVNMPKGPADVVS